MASWGYGGSNAPLRGGKDSDWEGGVRTPALLNGGWLPRERRGLRLRGLMHISDFYATFCTLASGAVPASAHTATTFSSTTTATSSSATSSTTSSSTTSSSPAAAAGAVSRGPAEATCLPDRGPALMDSVDLSDWLLRGDPDGRSPRVEIVHDVGGFRKGDWVTLVTWVTWVAWVT